MRRQRAFQRLRRLAALVFVVGFALLAAYVGLYVDIDGSPSARHGGAVRTALHVLPYAIAGGILCVLFILERGWYPGGDRREGITIVASGFVGAMLGLGLTVAMAFAFPIQIMETRSPPIGEVGETMTTGIDPATGRPARQITILWANGDSTALPFEPIPPTSEVDVTSANLAVGAVLGLLCGLFVGAAGARLERTQRDRLRRPSQLQPT
jgi:hypothetical protein